jgi:hypothetical protein
VQYFGHLNFGHSDLFAADALKAARALNFSRRRPVLTTKAAVCFVSYFSDATLEDISKIRRTTVDYEKMA